MRKTLMVTTIGILGVTVPAWMGGSLVQGEREPRLVEVKMVDKSATSFVFEPAEVTVRQGDIVRFVQLGVMPHNVEFRDEPEGSKLDEIRIGPFLTAKGQVYEVQIDERFVPGRYPFVCTPHVAMGMNGVLTVEAATNP